MEETHTQPFQFIDCSAVTLQEENEQKMSSYKQKTGKGETPPDIMLRAAREVRLNKRSIKSVAKDFSINYKKLCNFFYEITQEDLNDVLLLPPKTPIGFVAVQKSTNSEMDTGSPIMDPDIKLWLTAIKSEVSMIPVKKEKISKSFACDTCEESFSQKRYLMQHQISTHNGLQLYKCKVCWEYFVSRKKLMDHENLHCVLKKCQVACKVCKKYFLLKKKLIDHQCDCVLKKCQFACKVWKKYFLLKKKLIDHQCVVNVDSKFPCNMCKIVFITKLGLTHHQKRVHNKNT